MKDIIHLVSLFNEDTNHVGKFRECLEKQGWCFVRFDQILEKFLLPLVFSLENFFDLDLQTKSNFTIPPIWGYNYVDHKEGLRFGTSDLLDKTNIVPEMKKTIGQISGILDELLLQITQDSSDYFFGDPSQQTIELWNVPSLSKSKPQFGMLDFVLYHNKQTNDVSKLDLINKESPDLMNTQNLNCVPHYDPGLFSLSFLSTAPGLELQDENGDWIAGPLFSKDSSVGVLWCGDAAVSASGGKLKRGVHRVLYPNTEEPRIAGWYEMCTKEQAKELPIKKVTVKNVAGVPKNESKTIQNLEKDYGVPSTKVLYLGELLPREEPKQSKCVVL